MTIWKHLSHGPRYVAALERVRAAAASDRGETINETLVSDPELCDVLPHFDYIVRRGYRSRTAEAPRCWHHLPGPLTAFWTRLLKALPAAVTTTGLPDGRRRQTLSATDAQTVLRACEAETALPEPPADDRLAMYLAAAVAHLPGPAWQLDPDAAMIVRTADPSAAWSKLHACRTIVDALRWAARPCTTAGNERDAPAAPVMREILPHFGYSLPDAAAANTTQLRGPLTQDWSFTHYWREVEPMLQACVHNDPCPDGSVRQHIDALAVETTWYVQYRRRFPLEPVAKARSHSAYHIAAAIGTMPGPGWTIHADGHTLERILPAWPLRYLLPSATPVRIELSTRLAVSVVCWAALPAGSRFNDEPYAQLVLLSAVGPVRKLRACVAALQDRRRQIIALAGSDGPYHTTQARRPDGKRALTVFWSDELLEDSGLGHIVVQATELTQSAAARPFVHVAGADGTPDYALLRKQLDRALLLPLAQEWAMAQIFRDAIAAQLITTLPGYNCTAWLVDSTDLTRWSAVLARYAGATDVPEITTIGGTPVPPDVDEDVSECDVAA